MGSGPQRVATDHPVTVAPLGARRREAAAQLALLGDQVTLLECSDLAAAVQHQPDAVAMLIAENDDAGPAFDLLAAAARALPDSFRLVLGPVGSESLVRRAVNEGRAEAYLPLDAQRAELAAFLRRATGGGTARFTRARSEDLGEAITIDELEAELAACHAQLAEAHERLRATRNEVLQLELQASTSQLVRGLAHELNNPLTAIIGHTQRLRLRADDPDEVKRRAGILSTEAERCIALVERLRSLGSPLSEAVSSCQVGTVVGMACERLEQRRLGIPPIAYRRELPTILAAQRALARCIEQVLDNAIQAGAQHIWLDGELRSGRVHIAIDNDGATIGDEEIRHAVRPFFTTRSESGHHGLGLSLASSLLREMGGSLNLDRREDGPGARCTIILPTAGGRGDSTPARGVPTIAGNTVLVIDDEPMVAALLEDLVDDLGHRAVVCSNRHEALERLGDGDIGTVLCDVKLPDGDGIDLLTKAMRRWPRLIGHCALITGDARSPAIRERAAALEVPLIAKPFHLATVQRLLQDLV